MADALQGAGSGDGLVRFGRDVPHIAAAFRAAEGNFPGGKAPIGPVGAHVKLKDAKWGKRTMLLYVVMLL